MDDLGARRTMDKDRGTGKKQGCKGRLRALIRRLRRDHRGMMAVETAIALPILVGLLLSGVDYGRYVLILQKADRAAAVLADLVSQSEIVNSSDLEDMFLSVGYVMDPFNEPDRMTMIVTSMVGKGTTPTIAWQRRHGALPVSSTFGAQGQHPTLPANFVIRDGENVITAEVYLDFSPLFLPEELTAKIVRTVSYYRPRFAILDRIVDN
jgi:Flp pilus assembly protein TadG